MRMGLGPALWREGPERPELLEPSDRLRGRATLSAKSFVDMLTPDIRDASSILR